MKFGELYVHINYYTLNNIFYIKLLYMYDAMQNRAVCTFIKTENITVNEIGRIICSHKLLHAQ